MTLNIGQHRSILIKILKDIYTDISLGSRLGFKGGTAAYLFYGLPRFSVDLDFDLLNTTSRRDNPSSEEVLTKISRLASQYGLVKKQKNKQYILLVVLSYAAGEHNIKIEINKRDFGSRFEVKNFLGIPMLVMKKEDMFAHKLVALTERRQAAGRDIFDIYFFLKDNWEINREMVEKRTQMKFKAYLEKCLKFIAKVPDNRILAGVGELLRPEQKKWARENLKKETIFLLKLLLETI